MQGAWKSIGSAAGALILCASLAGYGCASSLPEVATHAPAPYAGNQGGAWESVVPPPTQPSADSEWAYARRDDALNVQGQGSLLGMDLWRDFPAPSLDQTRQLFLIQRPEIVTYYSDMSVQRSSRAAYRVYP